jgi:hypothetical protein
MTWEFNHANKAIKTGLYVTWISDDAKEDCFRVGADSKCFCGHLYKAHKIDIGDKRQKTPCGSCKCSEFKFIPRRPEEVGMWWLPRRKGFNVHQWRAPCKCKHGHDSHGETRPHKCS